MKLDVPRVYHLNLVSFIEIEYAWKTIISQQGLVLMKIRMALSNLTDAYFDLCFASNLASDQTRFWWK